MSFIEDVKTLSSGKWTATRMLIDCNSKQANKVVKRKRLLMNNPKEEIPNLAINNMLDILGEWEGTAILSSFTGYEENRVVTGK